MRKLILGGVLLIAACSGLPSLKPVPADTAHQIRNDCARVFPDGRWQLVHAIETVWPNRQSGTFIGVTILSSDSDRIDAVVSTLEGFTVFDASIDRQLIVRRAVPPFDSRQLALGLFEDIRLMFLEPQDPQPAAGLVASNAKGCRYQTEDGDVVEVVLGPPHGWQIHQYNAGGHLLRSVTATAVDAVNDIDKGPIPAYIELIGHRGAGYRLKLKLLEAIALSE